MPFNTERYVSVHLLDPLHLCSFTVLKDIMFLSSLYLCLYFRYCLSMYTPHLMQFTGPSVHRKDTFVTHPSLCFVHIIRLLPPKSHQQRHQLRRLLVYLQRRPVTFLLDIVYLLLSVSCFDEPKYHNS